MEVNREKNNKFFMIIAAFINGHLMQIDARIEPEKFNIISLDTSVLPDPITDYSENFIQLSDVNMHYRIYGSGKKPLILIHGKAFAGLLKRYF